MKILIIGSGGREHAIAWRLTQEGHQIYGAPGNPGIAEIARCFPADPNKPDALLAIAEREHVDLTVVGPEIPLSHGVVDLFATQRRAIVGPTAAAAALESSKAFAKVFMARHAVPTARFRTCDSADQALAQIASGEFGYPLVIKADGLAAGKGVAIVEDRAAAEAVIRDVMMSRKFGASGERVVLEEFLSGQEASYFVLADGASFMPLSSAQDHKRVFDDDRGPTPPSAVHMKCMTAQIDQFSGWCGRGSERNACAGDDEECRYPNHRISRLYDSSSLRVRQF